LTTSQGTVLQAMGRFSLELDKPLARPKEDQIRHSIRRWLAGE
jgi:hypothetical protein